MTIRELLNALLDHAEDGRRMTDEVLVRVNGTLRPVSIAYSDGTLILVTGAPIPR